MSNGKRVSERCKVLSTLSMVFSPFFSLSVKPNLFLIRVYHEPNLLYKLCSACHLSQEYFKSTPFIVK